MNLYAHTAATRAQMGGERERSLKLECATHARFFSVPEKSFTPRNNMSSLEIEIY